MTTGDDTDHDPFEGLEGSFRSQVETFESEAESVAADNARRKGRDRSWIAITIIVTYGIAIGFTMLYMVLSDASCETNTCVAWSIRSEAIADFVITAVLPIVTLMLGFYFGTETNRSE